jgi:hypothetical protein
LLEFLPVEWKFLIFWRKLIVPVLESIWSFLLNILSELLETFNFDEFLHGEPGKIRKPFFQWVQGSRRGWAVKQEVHLFFRVFNLDNLFLHESECELASEDLLMFLEETSGYPLVNNKSDDFSEGKYSLILFLECFGLVDSLKEEGGE